MVWMTFERSISYMVALKQSLRTDVLSSFHSLARYDVGVANSFLIRFAMTGLKNVKWMPSTDNPGPQQPAQTFFPTRRPVSQPSETPTRLSAITIVSTLVLKHFSKPLCASELPGLFQKIPLLKTLVTSDLNLVTAEKLIGSKPIKDPLPALRFHAATSHSAVAGVVIVW